MNLVDTAIRLALTAHHGVVNKHDGEAYILHVHRVASNFGEETLDDQICKAIAWLHDTVEDTDLTLSGIATEFTRAGHTGLHEGVSIVNLIIEGVDAMTKRSGESNEEYYYRVKRNSYATRVKICDIIDNFGRNHAVTDEAKKLRMAQKYSLGLEILARQT